MNQIKATPAAGSVTAGLIASLCCGGSLIFASIGLGLSGQVSGFSDISPRHWRLGLCASSPSTTSTIVAPPSEFPAPVA